MASISKPLVISSSLFSISQLFPLHSAATHHTNVFKSIPTLSVLLTHLCNPLSSFISALTISFFIVFSLQKFLMPSDFSGIVSGMPQGKHLNETQKDRIYSDVCKDHTVEHIFSFLLLFSPLTCTSHIPACYFMILLLQLMLYSHVYSSLFFFNSKCKSINYVKFH